MQNKMFALIILLAVAAIPARADRPIPYPSGFSVDVLIDGRPAPQYAAHGARYIEALKGREYEIRLHNPLGVRVAVALSVDGLNTIDARHSDARSARKWVLEPYQTITLSGWQTTGDQARRFYFTTEDQSYGKWLGKTSDLGIITAVFFRERMPQPPPPPMMRPEQQSGAAAGAPRRDQERNKSQAESSAKAAPADEYSATGIGQRIDHHVVRVFMDLEDTPAAAVNIRYEYRPQLVRLGIFPPPPPFPDPLTRRQQARGFDGNYCPEPK
jgi:hypothetical protein